MRIQLRIVAGRLRGRKLNCTIHPGVRPTPQMVREALFSILGDAVPGRPYYDVFAGTGAVGLEALSRGARHAVFVERDTRLANALERHVREFGVAAEAQVVRGDVYRWAQRWQAPAEPVNVFISPPFADFEDRPDALLQLLSALRQKAAAGSVLVLQSEKTFPVELLPGADEWELRGYGRNQLHIWVKESGGEEATPPDGGPGSSPE